MRVAALERFADPARRCDPERIARDGDELEIWELPGIERDLRSVLRLLPSAIGDWLDTSIPIGERLSLLRACLASRGAGPGALARAPSLWRGVRGGEIDRLACFSAKGFALAELLSEVIPCEEQISRGTKYFGEFGFELYAVIPYAYWLHARGELEFTVSTADTGCLYYFSEDHRELPLARRFAPITDFPIGRPGALRYDHVGFPADPDMSRWQPPPYKQHYASDRFDFGKELCVVANKQSDDGFLRREVPVNSIDTELLLALIRELRRAYQVVYCRPRGIDIVNDHQPILDSGDIEAVKRAYPEVLTIQDLQVDNPDLSFNELQLRLFAGCERFVSVVGGSAFLCSYFGGTNVVYARRGWEVDSGAYENWFSSFSGARVVSAGSPNQLLQGVRGELLGAEARA